MRGVRTIKTRNYAEHSPELSVHIYGFSTEENRDKLAEEIKDVIRKFRRTHEEKHLERKITLD